MHSYSTGYGIHIFGGISTSSSTVAAGSLQNNGLVVTPSAGDSNGLFLRIFSRSDSMMDNVGNITGLEDTVISNGHFAIEHPQPGEITMVTRGPLPSNEQGVYTCRLPDSTDTMRNINITGNISGFTGDTCDVNIYDCELDPCLNGGTCNDEVDGFTCDCISGFTGDTCDVNIDDCEPNPCLNGGTCNDEVDGFMCDCISGFTGDTCDVNINDCEPDPCLNGGTCNDEVDGFMCDCISGFTGDTCDTEGAFLFSRSTSPPFPGNLQLTSCACILIRNC